MRIENVNVFCDDGAFRKGAVAFNDVITGVEFDREEAQQPAQSGQERENSDADPYLVPGLVDIHTHGAVHGDHSDGSPELMQEMGAFYAKNGVTSFLATTMTYGEEKLVRAMQNISGYQRRENGARCAGVNMEGPFLSYEKRGAHAPEYLTPPDIPMFERLNKASGNLIRIVSVAPETPGAMGFICDASQVCKVALAHSAAGYDTAMEAFGNGATQVTHLFNAMNPFLHRDPGMIGAAMDARAYVEIISDGVHLHPAVVRAVFNMYPDRVCLISDSIRSAGLPDGAYESGGMPIIVKEGKATLKDGTIAGSNVSLMQCVRTAVGFGVPLEKALAAATINNARAIGMEDRLGSLRPGAFADMALLDGGLNIQKVYIGGNEIIF